MSHVPKPEADGPRLVWHIGDDDNLTITLHADGRIDGDLAALKARLADPAYQFGDSGHGMTGLVQTVIWLLVQELRRQA